MNTTTLLNLMQSSYDFIGLWKISFTSCYLDYNFSFNRLENNIIYSRVLVQILLRNLFLYVRKYQYKNKTLILRMFYRICFEYIWDIHIQAYASLLKLLFSSIAIIKHYLFFTFCRLYQIIRLNAVSKIY